MEIGAVLNKLNWMWRQVKAQLDAGKERIKVEFDERKASGKWYFTYFSRDGVHELRMWLAERKRILEGLMAAGKAVDPGVLEGEPIFITGRGTVLRENQFVIAHLKFATVAKSSQARLVSTSK